MHTLNETEIGLVCGGSDTGLVQFPQIPDGPWTTPDLPNPFDPDILICW